jgi:polyisoprenoid-binding protein YceI
VADRRVALAVIAVFVAFLEGCASQVAAPPLEIGKREPDGFPAAYYQQLLVQGKAVFRVDPARSRLVIEVRRGGSLVKFGHDHVVASHDTAGRIAPDEGRADLWVPLDALVVDESALRREAGFDTQPSSDDIAGTRSNMLKRVLETDQHPYALIAVDEIAAGGSTQQARVTVTLHGTTRSVDTTAQFARTAAEVSVTGAIEIDQSRFGIAPFSLLGGAIAVQDRVKITFRIHADRINERID